MANIRAPAVAGRFYPRQKTELKRLLDDCFRYAQPARDFKRPVRAVIVPHAGLVYSGPIAASAYQLISARTISRVLLIGPNHYVPVRGVVAPTATAFRTPLGDVPIDQAFIGELAARGLVNFNDRAHVPEHSLEVQVPFLQTALATSFTIIPLLIGDDAKREVEQILALFARDEASLIVVSTDLSHFESYDSAKHHDRVTATSIVSQHTIGHAEDACGFNALNGFLSWVKTNELEVVELDLRNSGDTSGDKSRVVGYGSFAII